MIRIDIQALRGVAIILVIAYHSDIGIVEAGYLGVDIFFVISGFLITGIIKCAIEGNRFSYTEFYFRRAKRLLPAAYVTILLTATISPFFLNSRELQDLNAQVLGAITFTANLVLLMQSGYFAGAADLKPLLHIWSLSLEEQYYFLLPIFLAVLPIRYWRNGTVTIFMCSAALCFLGLHFKPEWTFYLLPTRAWELAIGSMIALGVFEGSFARFTARLLYWPSWALLIVVPAFPSGLPHPGLDALIVCFATAVIIIRKHPNISSFPGVAQVAKVGNMSYSLYLAHWPPMAFLKNAAVGPIPIQYSIFTTLIGVAIGSLLYFLVERPIQRMDFRPSKRVTPFVIGTTLIVALVPYAISTITHPSIDLAHERRPNDGFGAICASEPNFTPRQECMDSDNPTLLVWGDSYARLYAVSSGN